MTIKPCICKLLQLGVCAILFGNLSATDRRVDTLAKEVQAKGWIIVSARSESGDWDLYMSRPDGSQRLNLTNSPDRHEMGARFSRTEGNCSTAGWLWTPPFTISTWGLQGSLVMANSDGSHAVELGGRGDYPWASWSRTEARSPACTRMGSRSMMSRPDLVVSKMPRQGIYQQLFWSPDGTMVCGRQIDEEMPGA